MENISVFGLQPIKHVFEGFFVLSLNFRGLIYQSVYRKGFKICEQEPPVHAEN